MAQYLTRRILRRIVRQVHNANNGDWRVDHDRGEAGIVLYGEHQGFEVRMEKRASEIVFEASIPASFLVDVRIRDGGNVTPCGSYKVHFFNWERRVWRQFVEQVAIDAAERDRAHLIKHAEAFLVGDGPQAGQLSPAQDADMSGALSPEDDCIGRLALVSPAKKGTAQ